MKAKATLESELRNRLSPIESLITYLENEPIESSYWESVFREASIRSCKEMISLLKEFPYKGDSTNMNTKGK